jgi:hypothetical protein
MIEQDEEVSENISDESIAEQIPTASASSPLPHSSENPRSDHRKPKHKPQERRSFERFITVSWSAQREPVDSMYWCEAERKGAWVEVTALDQVRTRKEILERLTELDAGLVGLDFGFSYPAPFMEFLQQNAGVADWRGLLTKAREELKKNVDDGVRIWIERMGTYREAHLDPNPMPIRTYERGRYGREMKERKPEPFEVMSSAERFRRTEIALRRAAEGALTSTIQVSFNRLTGRYEFSDPNQQGKRSLLGMSMLEQLLEAREDIAIWPWKKQAKVTICEIFPWLFRREGPADPKTCRVLLAAEEDNGTEVDSTARDLICRDPEAQRAFFSMMGMLRTEARVERSLRPLRDYVPQFYADPKVQAEGWFYGVGYKSLEDKQREEKSAEKQPTDKKRERRPRDRRPNHQEREADASVVTVPSDREVSEPVAESTTTGTTAAVE